MRFPEGDRIIKINAEFELTYRFQNLYQITSPRIEELGNSICQNRLGGEIFRDELHEVGILMGKGLPLDAQQAESESAMIIGIPRGGVPLAEGVKQSLPNAQLFFTNDGKNADPYRPLLALDTPEGYPNLILIIDTVVDLGSTDERTVREAYSQFPNSTISIISLITSVDGAFRLENTFPNLKHYTAIVEKETRWIELSKNINRRIIPKIGDVGELVSGQ